MTTPEFWRGRRVFVTGHTGFKGSWLALWLLHLGAEPVGYALEPPTSPSHFELARLGGDMRSIVGDVRDGARLAAEMRAHEPEIVIHAAAQALVRESYTDPVATFQTNVVGTANVLEAVRHVPEVRAVIVVTSDKCYEPVEGTECHREGDALGGRDPYSASKACAELVTGAYRSSFFHPDGYAEHGVGVATARAGNVVGGGDWSADRLLPDVFRAILSDRNVRLRYPAATRPWQHVLDPLAGYLALAEALHDQGAPFAEAWNFGPAASDIRAVSDVVDHVMSTWGTQVGWEVDPSSQPHETRSLRLDSTEARTRLGWTPRLDIADALTWAVEWTKEWHQGHDVRATSEDQLRRYTELVAP